MSDHKELCDDLRLYLTQGAADKAADLIEHQAARIAELEKKLKISKRAELFDY